MTATNADSASIRDAVYGCLVGGAIGDSLGGTVEGWSYEQIGREYGKIEEFRAYTNPYSEGEPGSVTDDTILRHYLCLAIVREGGRVTPEEYADVLVDHLDRDRVWVTEEIMLEKLLAGTNPWTAGRGTIPGGTAAMAIAPIGIVNAGNPRQAYQDGFNVASINQDGEDRDAAATVAAGVAEAFTPGATIDDVLETMTEYSTSVVFRAIDLTMEVAERSATVDDFVEAYYDELLDWRWPAVDWDREQYHQGELFSGSSVEIVPVTMAILSLCDGSANESIVEAASFGRDCDTIGTLAGNITGALAGADRIRDDWIEDVEAANRDFFEELFGDPDADFGHMADRLVDALVAERDRAERRRETLDAVLDGES